MDILVQWSNKEGEVNNIVDHDEYGNKASDHLHDHYPDTWR